MCLEEVNLKSRIKTILTAAAEFYEGQIMVGRTEGTLSEHKRERGNDNFRPNYTN